MIHDVKRKSLYAFMFLKLATVHQMCTPDVTLVLYADDMAVLAQHRNIHGMINYLQIFKSDLST